MELIRHRRIVVALAASILVVLLAGVAVRSRSRDGDAEPSRVRLLPRPPVATPDPDVAWWTPVHGEPLGVATDGTDVATAALDEVRLLDATDGRTRWKATVPGVRRYRPALAGDRVVATGETELVLLERAGGARVASVPFAGPGPAGVVPEPGGRSVAVAGSETGELLAVEVGDGEQRWRAHHAGEVVAAPVGAGGTVLASWHDGTGSTLRAFDGRTGVLRWERPLGPVAGPPALAGDLVVVAHGPGIHSAVATALDPATGAERWQAPLPGWWDGALEPVVGSDALFLLDGMGTVVALDPATGTVRWRSETGRPLVAARLALTPDTVAFASYDDELMVLDRADGRLLAAEAQRGVPVDLAGVRDRLVVALRLARPSRVEAVPVPAAPTGAPGPAPGRGPAAGGR